MKRNYYLDTYRGLTIISMIIFHLCYNINYYKSISRYDGSILNKIWQLSIAISFFLISGITSSLISPKKNINRGLKTSALGFLISLITYLFAREQLIVWGVLNALGLSMIITGLLQERIKISSYFCIIFVILFALTYSVPSRSLAEISFFNNLYMKNIFLLGFPSNEFSSSDYFPMIPWLFMYLAGFTAGNFLKEKNFYKAYGKDNFLARIGRLAMPIYLSHQIILYPLVSLFFEYF